MGQIRFLPGYMLPICGPDGAGATGIQVPGLKYYFVRFFNDLTTDSYEPKVGRGNTGTFSLVARSSKLAVMPFLRSKIKIQRYPDRGYNNAQQRIHNRLAVVEVVGDIVVHGDG